MTKNKIYRKQILIFALLPFLSYAGEKSLGISINGYTASGIDEKNSVYEGMAKNWNTGFGVGLWSELQIKDKLCWQVTIEAGHEEIEVDLKYSTDENSWNINNYLNTNTLFGANHKINESTRIKGFAGLGIQFGHEKSWIIPYWDTDEYSSDIKILVDRHYYYWTPTINANIEAQYKRIGLRIAYSRELNRYSNSDMLDYGPLVEKIGIGLAVEIGRSL